MTDIQHRTEKTLGPGILRCNGCSGTNFVVEIRLWGWLEIDASAATPNTPKMIREHRLWATCIACRLSMWIISWRPDEVATKREGPIYRSGV